MRGLGGFRTGGGTTFGIVAILGMLAYAVPRIEVAGGDWAASAFAVCWLFFALLILAAHLHHGLKVDEEAARELERIRRVNRWKRGQWLAVKGGMQGESARGLR